MTELRGRVVAVRDLSSRELGAWRDLARRAAEPNPLFEAECVLSAARHIPGGQDIGLVVAEAGGEYFGAVPVRMLSRWHRVPFATATTDVRRMTYLGTPLVDAGRDVAALRVMLGALAARQGSGAPSVVELRWVHAGGVVHRALRQLLDNDRFTAYAVERFDRPLVSRRPEPSYADHFNSKYRNLLARRHRQLGKELGAEAEVVNLGGSPAAVDELIAMEDRGYKGRTGVSLTSIHGEPEYFHEMCSAFAADDRVQILALRAGYRTAAMQMSVRGAEGLFALKVVYDEGLSRFGPGVALQLGAIEHFHRHTDAEWIDSCTYPDNEALLRLYPDRRPIVTYLVALGATGAGLVKVLHGLRAGFRDGRLRPAVLPAHAHPG